MSGITRYVPRQIVSNSTFWGFIVYRLVYTPESDALWPAIIAKLNAYVHRSMWQDKGYNFNYDKTSPPSSFDYAVDVPDSMWFQNVVFSDPKFANFSIDGIRNHFIEFLDTTPAPERRVFQQEVCLFIDEEVLWWIRDDPGVTMPHERSSRTQAAVKALDVGWDPDNPRDGELGSSPGWALVPLCLVRFLHEIIDPDLTLTSLSTDEHVYPTPTGAGEGVLSFRG